MTEKLTKTEKLLLEYFRKFPLNKPITTEQNELAKSLGCSRMSIARAVKSLEEKGYIRKESGKEDGTENKYFLISPEKTSKPPSRNTKTFSRKYYVCKNFTRKSNIITKTFIEEINKAKISAKRPETHTQLIDKLSTLIFSGKISKTGEYEIAVESNKDKGKKEISTILDIDFSEIEQSQTLKLSKPLTPYDKRLYNVVCSLWKAGNTHISLAQIYRGMEQKAGTPNAKQAQKIRESAEKMAAIRIEIDNRKEAEAYNYPLFQSGRTYLLPSESITNRSIEMNGKILDYCLRLYREPPLLTYAMKHKQIALFTLEQAALPDKMRITDDNLLLDDYLKKRIARMKREKKISQSYNGKILYSTIYENCGIDNKVKRSRTTEKLRILLKHYQNTKLIEKYKERTDGITIIT